MRNKIKFDLKYARAILSGKKRATIRVGERKYANEVKIYIGERYAGKAKVVKQFPFRIKNLQSWMVRKEGMDRKTLLKELARLYGKITNKLFTFVEFELEPTYFIGMEPSGDSILVYVIDGSQRKVVSKEIGFSDLVDFLKSFDPRTVAINCNKEEIYSGGELEFVGDCEESVRLLRKLRNKIKGNVILTNCKYSKGFIKSTGKFSCARICAMVAYLHFLGETEDVSGIKVPKEM